MYHMISHADWSKNRTKRWQAKAEGRQSGWEIYALKPAFCKLDELLLREARDKRVLACPLFWISGANQVGKGGDVGAGERLSYPASKQKHVLGPWMANSVRRATTA
jgi:hypothetical protein